MIRQEFIETVTRFAQIGDKRKIVFLEMDQLAPVNIARGILFIFAGWSGPSVHAWKALTRSLSTTTDLDFEFYVVDADKLPIQFADQELQLIPQGNGETFWICKGKIFRSRAKYGDASAELIRAFTTEVFN